MSSRQLLVSAMAVASIVAVFAVGCFVLAVTVGPTPEELAERFRVFVEGESSESAAVAKRIMALDANGDTYVARQELPERMQGLMRGDQNRDGALSAQEVITMLNQKPPARPRLAEGPFPRKGPASLSDVVTDLRLPAAKHRVAMDLVAKIQPDFYVRLRQALDDEEYENLLAAAARIGMRRF